MTGDSGWIIRARPRQTGLAQDSLRPQNSMLRQLRYSAGGAREAIQLVIIIQPCAASPTWHGLTLSRLYAPG